MKKTKPRKPAKGRLARRMAALVLILCTGASAVLCVLAFKELSERNASNSYYEGLSESFHKSTAVPSAAPSTVPTLTAAPYADAVQTAVASATPLPTVAAAPVYDAAAQPSPTAEAPSSALDFDLILETYPDVVGWITIEGTEIDYPIVQGDDNDYYLNHLPDGTRNAAGSIMLDAACDGVFGNELNILHGHHMKNHSMFGSLDYYKQSDYYYEHPTICLYTPAGDYDVAIFAACTLDGEEFGYPTEFSSDEAFDKFIAKCRKKSAFTSDVEVARGDRLLLLSTCSYSYETERMVVIGKLIEN